MQTTMEHRIAGAGFFCHIGTTSSSVAASVWKLVHVNMGLEEGRTQHASSDCINSCKANSIYPKLPDKITVELELN